MTYDQTQFQPTYRQPRMHPAFGMAAVAATVMTLSLAVIAPMQLAPTALQAHVDPKHLVLGPTEVAILPARIDVVASPGQGRQAREPLRAGDLQAARLTARDNYKRAGRREASGPLCQYLPLESLLRYCAAALP